MSKGVTGKVLTIIITIVIALFVLVLLWIILNNLTGLLTRGVSDVMISIKCSFCEKIGLFKKLGGMCDICV